MLMILNYVWQGAWDSLSLTQPGYVYIYNMFKLTLPINIKHCKAHTFKNHNFFTIYKSNHISVTIEPTNLFFTIIESIKDNYEQLYYGKQIKTFSFNQLLDVKYYMNLRYLSSIAILTTTRDQTTHLALVHGPIP